MSARPFLLSTPVYVPGFFAPPEAAAGPVGGKTGEFAGAALPIKRRWIMLNEAAN